MSRFYEALTEASRSRSSSMQVGGSVNSGEVEVPEPEVPTSGAESIEADLLNLAGIPTHRASQHDVAKPVEPLQAIASDLDVPPTEIIGEPVPSHQPKLEEASQAESDPARVTFEAKVVIGFDPTARLIPHAIDAAVVEHYRRLRTKILQQHTDKPFQSLMVTSPGPQEGKTVTVLNLGLSFAMLPNFNVLVIDGDLRRGSIGKWLGADQYPGLSDVLGGSGRLEDVALKCAGVSMHVVTRGNSKVSPAELLHSPKLATEFRRITNHFDLVLIDTPPVTLITDSQLLAGSCDAVLLIARAFQTRRKALEQSVKDLSAFRIIGTVLNGGTRAALYRKYNGYY